ncbi:hypothetical protein [Streptomyces justiciae]|uniref:Protein kinase domain-containing protein n=1 Tax=Streptomyces justiciae TaxID=2780140 RepID=A0ABU3LJ86_9ACTN|nr:hypothetical protein [Streptomyces justiciae]MDT7839304.1 hypothetical protein [Streptomyces justiciae]
MAVSRGGPSAPGPGAVRKFPTGALYAEALQHPELCFSDPDLRHGTVEQSPVLGPKAISGNFASVFSVTAPGGQRYALKCFTRDSATLGKRYAAISSALGALDSGALSQPWSVGFDFLEQGVLVQGHWFPVVRMTWVQGTGLISWIERNLQDPAAVRALADRFVALVADLEDNGIAHGDLQHGNLLVAADGTIRLVDYDGMYVPALRGEQATENGHRNYQSPSRTAADFGPHMDRFSAWVIALSLVAVATDPGLWHQLHDPQGESLILSEPDFKEPATSLAWPVLLHHSDARVRELADRVKGLVAVPCSALPALTADAVKVPAQRSGGKAKSGNGPRTTAAQAGTPPWSTATATGTSAAGVPAWMADRVPAAPTTPATPAAPAAAPAGTGFGRRRFGDLVAGAGALLSTSAPGALVLTAVQPASALPGSQTAALVLAVAALAAGRRRRPEYRDARAQIADLKRRARELADPARAHQRIWQEIHALDTDLAKDNAASDKKVRALQTELKDGLARITMNVNRRTGKAQQELTGLPAKEKAQLAAALEPAVRAHVQDRLRRTPIREARSLTNMGPKMVTALEAAGIRTAADFTGVVYSVNQGYGSRNAYLVLVGGHRVKVPGIGEARATTLESWRQNLEQRARQSAPTTVPAQDKARIKADIAALRRRLKAEVKQAEADAQRERDALQQRITGERTRLTAQRQQHATDIQRKRADLIRQQKQLAGSDQERARVLAQLTDVRKEAKRSLGRVRYARFVLTGH